MRWRGRSVTVRFLRELTFWARKRAALRIGGGDLIELLTRIDAFVKRTNADGADRAHMLTMGHSFGGTMIYAALANILKARLVEALDRQDNPDPRATIVEGFGDIVVLVNPAFEASLYLTLHDLSATLKKLSPLQGPVLITIESETDRPNRTPAPARSDSRDLFNKAASPVERLSMRTAVGNYSEFWDYRLTAADGEPTPPRRELRLKLGASGNCSCDLNLETSDAGFEPGRSWRRPYRIAGKMIGPRRPSPAGSLATEDLELTCPAPP